MSRRLKLVLTAVASAGVLAFVAASVAYTPANSRISPNHDDPSLVWVGLLFWIGVTAATSAMPVRMPQGIRVDVAFAPLLAAMSLGGPAAVAWIALVGTTEARELRGEVPWYGIVGNRAAIIAPFVAAGILLDLCPGRESFVVDLLATTLAGVVFYVGNVLLNAMLTSAKSGLPTVGILKSSAGALLNLLALAPIAWLMAQMYEYAGWWAVLLFAVPLYTTRLAYQRFVEIREMFTQTVRSLAEAVDKRDTFTSNHSNRVQEIAMDIGRAMKLTDVELEALEWGALLHDIGKIGVPDSVLLKQERLTREERATMNKHPIIGAEIIAPVTRLAPELPIIRHHHEWFNGSGYPDRLVADQIPKLARVLHVADAFEAMTAQRPYRMTPMTSEMALRELRRFGGIQFDPEVVDAFVRTRWADEVPDPGRPESRQVPLLGETAGAMAMTPLDVGEDAYHPGPMVSPSPA